MGVPPAGNHLRRSVTTAASEQTFTSESLPGSRVEEPPEFRILDAVDGFCERLLLDCRSPEVTRQRLRDDLEDSSATEQSHAAAAVARRLLKGNRDVLGHSNVEQPGERYVKETLVWPLLDALGYEYRIEPYLADTENRCDFLTVNTRRCLLGECKSPNRYDQAVHDLRAYTQVDGVSEQVGIATDGFNWLLVRHTEGRFPRRNVLAEIDIRALVASRLRMKGVHIPRRAAGRPSEGSTVDVHSDHLRETDPTKIAQSFHDFFAPARVDAAISDDEV